MSKTFFLFLPPLDEDKMMTFKYELIQRLHK